MGRRAARKDGNHDGICQALEVCGWSVMETFQVGDGFPDAVIAKHGRVIFCEIKDGGLSPSRRRLSPDEERFKRRCEAAGMDYRVVTCIEEAVRL